MAPAAEPSSRGSHMSRAFRWALPTSVAFLAFVIGATGILHTAEAATGSAVNIADPAAAANLAKVDTTGALRVTVGSGTVGARPVVASSPFHADGSVPNFYANGFTPVKVLGPSNATVVITNFTAMLESTTGVAWDGAVWLAGSTSTTCSAPSVRKALLAVPAADMREIAYGDAPLVIKPPSGSSYWCLMATFGPLNASSSDSGNFYLQMTGYVSSGTFVSPQAPAAPAAPSSSSSSPTASHSATGGERSSFAVVPSDTP